MVVLHMTALDNDANERKFSCVLSTLEDVFEFLTNTVARGHTLLSAHTVNEWVRTELPVAEFDGQSMVLPVEALIKQYTIVLQESGSVGCTHRRELASSTRRQLRGQQAREASLRHMVNRYTQWQEWLNQSVQPSARQQRVDHRYESQLVIYQTLLEQTRLSIALLTHRLTRLVDSIS